MSKQSIVIYHGDCPDGFAAALAAWLKLRDTADYLPYQYGMEPPNVTGKSVYIVDFSFPREQMEALEAVATRVVLLDHHQTAIDKLEGYKCTCGKVRLARYAKSGASDEPRTVHQHNSHTVLQGVRGFDVRALAEAFGGGGHKEAAALRLPATRITDLVAGVLEPTPAS